MKKTIYFYSWVSHLSDSCVHGSGFIKIFSEIDSTEKAEEIYDAIIEKTKKDYPDLKGIIVLTSFNKI